MENVRGKYVDFVVDERGDLRIEINEEGVELLWEMADSFGGDMTDADPFIWAIAEDILCNSAWEEVLPQDIGALTNGLLMGYDVERNDDDEVVNADQIWWDCGGHSMLTFGWRFINYGYVILYKQGELS